MPDLDEQIRELVSGVTPVTAQEVIAARQSSLDPATPRPRDRRPRRVNAYAIGAAGMATAICILVVVLILGFGLASTSKPSVISPGPTTAIPAPWQKVTFGGLTMYAPGSWPTFRTQAWGGCGLTSQPLFKDNAVELDTGVSAIVYHCPSLSPNKSVPPVSGLLIDPGPNGPLPEVSRFAKRLQINGLGVDPASTVEGGMLVLAVSIPGRAQPVAVEIGLAGGGKVAHTIEYSMRASGSKPNVSPTTPTTTTTATTTKTGAGQWAERTIANTSAAQNITPTPDGVFWFAVASPGQALSLFRYDPATGRTVKGPLIGGAYDLAFSAGRVWALRAVGGSEVVVEEISPFTLDVQRRIPLDVKNIPVDPSGPTFINGSLAPTLDGPLWVAVGEDMWALNPSSGAVEQEFDTGYEIDSISTDPTGDLLYEGGATEALGRLEVAEYDARTGRELSRFGESTYVGYGDNNTVAAADGGVWVSYLSESDVTPPTGAVFELSADGLHQIAAGVTDTSAYSTYHQSSSIQINVSDGALWLTILATTERVSCANPTTGVVEASQHALLFNLVASGRLLYASTASAVVAVTPPAACFG